MICTKCGQTVCIARLARGTEYWCKTCGDVPRDALKVSMQRIAELESALAESRALRDDLWRALKEKSEVAF